MIKFSKGIDLPNGYVPQTYYFLWNNNNIVRLLKMRHYLTDSLRNGAGHIGYDIHNNYRGKGNGTITLVFPFDSELTNEELSLYLKECLSDIQPFKIELEGFSKQENKYGNYLLLNIAHGMYEIKLIHDRLYKDKLKQFEIGYDYIPHMTVGRVSSAELLNKAFYDINKCYNKFSPVVKKISVEMIGENEESIIKIEHELH